MTEYDREYFDNKVNGAQNLNLNGLLIGDAGVKLLAESLKKNSTVAWLDLQYNRIGPEVSVSATKDRSFIMLEIIIYIDTILFTGQGAKVLASVLKSNNSITDLHLNGNLLREDGARALAGYTNTVTFSLDENLL